MGSADLSYTDVPVKVMTQDDGIDDEQRLLAVESLGSECGQGRNRTADTRIFSSVLVPGLCVTIGRQLNVLKRLTLLRAR